MPFTTVPAYALSITALTEILGRCFQDYFVPFTLTPEQFAARFIAEGLSFADSCVWYADNEPVAIALITRRGNRARLAAFAIQPGWRGKGLTKPMLGALFAGLKDVTSLSLEVIRENAPAIALYESLGFSIARELCGYQGKLVEPVDALAAGSLDGLLCAVYRGPAENTPWQLDPLSFPSLPCQVVKDGEHAWGVIATLTATPQLRYLFVDPAYRHQGLARQLLQKINAQYPGIGTPVAIPATFASLFEGAGYQEMVITQYEMVRTA